MRKVILKDFLNDRNHIPWNSSLACVESLRRYRPTWFIASRDRTHYISSADPIFVRREIKSTEFFGVLFAEESTKSTTHLIEVIWIRIYCDDSPYCLNIWIHGVQIYRDYLIITCSNPGCVVSVMYNRLIFAQFVSKIDIIHTRTFLVK